MIDYKDYCELYHHGIKGQKWGVRRFQNEDGSWTPAGSARYGEGPKATTSVKEVKASKAAGSVKKVAGSVKKAGDWVTSSNSLGASFIRLRLMGLGGVTVSRYAQGAGLSKVNLLSLACWQRRFLVSWL